MTKFFLIAIPILLAIGIPVSAICWWIRSFSYYPLFHPSPPGWLDIYWSQWTNGIKIASIVLAALWILDLIIWIIAKKRENKFYGELGSAMSMLRRGSDWIVDEHGQATRPPEEATEPPVSTPTEFIDPSELIRPRSVFEEGQDFLSKYKYHENEHAKGETESTKEGKMKNYENDARVFLMKQKVSRLVEEGRLTPNEAIKLRQDIENSIDSPETYLDTKRFLQAIRHRPSK